MYACKLQNLTTQINTIMNIFSFFVYTCVLLSLGISAHEDTCEVDISGFNSFDGRYRQSDDERLFIKKNIRAEIFFENDRNGSCSWIIGNVDNIYPRYVKNSCEFSVQNLGSWDLYTDENTYTTIPDTHVSKCFDDTVFVLTLVFSIVGGVLVLVCIIACILDHFKQYMKQREIQEAHHEPVDSLEENTVTASSFRSTIPSLPTTSYRSTDPIPN